MVLDAWINFPLKNTTKEEKSDRVTTAFGVTKNMSSSTWAARKKFCLVLVVLSGLEEPSTALFPFWFVAVGNHKNRQESQGTTKGPDWDERSNLHSNSQLCMAFLNVSPGRKLEHWPFSSSCQL